MVVPRGLQRKVAALLRAVHVGDADAENVAALRPQLRRDDLRHGTDLPQPGDRGALLAAKIDQRLQVGRIGQQVGRLFLAQPRELLLYRRVDAEQAARPRSKRSEEHTSELQSLMRISYAVFCLKKKNKQHT